jgi:type I restriction enzyme S subunit
VSRIDDLLEELCPEGLPFKPLGDVCTVFSGFAFQSALFNDSGEGVPLIRIRDVNTGFSRTYFSGEYDDRFVVTDGDLLIGMDGDFRVVRWRHGRALLNQRVCRLQDFADELLPEFMLYVVQDALDRIHSASQGSTVKHLSSRDLQRAKIPIPPLKVQREIVELLDQLTQLNEDLEEGLNEELEARVTQYDALMQSVVSAIDAPRETLRELGQWRGGVTPSKANSRYWEEGSIPWLASMDVSASEGKEIRGLVTPAAVRETSLRIIPSPSVVTVMRSNILRRRLPVGLVEVDTTINQDIRALVPRDGVDAGYVYQVLRSTSETIRQAVVRTDGSMAAVDSKAFFEWTIPVPPLTEQQRIAVQLRELDTVSNELRQALVSERDARRRQYKHYRDRLLAFEEATV